MGSENLKALEEIKALGHRVELAGDADLETIRQRLEWVAGKYPGDPEVQKAAEEMKRLIMSRANRLRWSASATTVPGTSPTVPDSTLSTIEIAPPTIPQGVLSAPPSLPPLAPQMPPQIPWKRALGTGIAVGIGLSLLMIVVLVNVARKRNIPGPDWAAAPRASRFRSPPRPPGRPSA